MLNLGLDLTTDQTPEQIDEDNTPKYETLPEGNYQIVLVDYKIENPILFKSGAEGAVADMSFEVSDGPHKGAKLWQYCVYQHNSSAAAANAGQANLKTLFASAGADDAAKAAGDLGACVGKPVICEVFHDEYKGKVKAAIRGKSFRPVEAPSAPSFAPAETSTAPAAATEENKPAWL